MQYKKNTRRGFTLIELLVVVLIIGILAAVAVPQYQRAVEKSKATQGIALVRSLAQAAQTYYLANGEYATSLDQLDVSLSQVQKDAFYCVITSTCNKKEWGVELYTNMAGTRGIISWRTSSKYKGGGFVIYQKINSSSLKTNTLYCYERTVNPNAIEKSKSYCEKLFNAKHVASDGNAMQFALP